MERNKMIRGLLYECDWIINENTVVKPDILLICGDYNKSEHIKTVPALIVEIFSPSTRLKDRNTKFSLYEQYGVKYYLMADPEKKSIEYFKLVDNKYKEQNMLEIFEPEKDCSIALNLSGVFSE